MGKWALIRKVISVWKSYSKNKKTGGAALLALAALTILSLVLSHTFPTVWWIPPIAGVLSLLLEITLAVLVLWGDFRKAAQFEQEWEQAEVEDMQRTAKRNEELKITEKIIEKLLLISDPQLLADLFSALHNAASRMDLNQRQFAHNAANTLQRFMNTYVMPQIEAAVKTKSLEDVTKALNLLGYFAQDLGVQCGAAVPQSYRIALSDVDKEVNPKQKLKVLDCKWQMPAQQILPMLPLHAGP